MTVGFRFLGALLGFDRRLAAYYRGMWITSCHEGLAFLLIEREYGVGCYVDYDYDYDYEARARGFAWGSYFRSSRHEAFWPLPETKKNGVSVARPSWP